MVRSFLVLDVYSRWQLDYCYSLFGDQTCSQTRARYVFVCQMLYYVFVCQTFVCRPDSDDKAKLLECHAGDGLYQV